MTVKIQKALLQSISLFLYSFLVGLFPHSYWARGKDHTLIRRRLYVREEARGQLRVVSGTFHSSDGVFMVATPQRSEHPTVASSQCIYMFWFFLRVGDRDRKWGDKSKERLNFNSCLIFIEINWKGWLKIIFLFPERRTEKSFMCPHKYRQKWMWTLGQ